MHLAPTIHQPTDRAAARQRHGVACAVAIAHRAHQAEALVRATIGALAGLVVLVVILETSSGG